MIPLLTFALLTFGFLWKVQLVDAAEAWSDPSVKSAVENREYAELFGEDRRPQGILVQGDTNLLQAGILKGLAELDRRIRTFTVTLTPEDEEILDRQRARRSAMDFDFSALCARVADGSCSSDSVIDMYAKESFFGTPVIGFPQHANLQSTPPRFWPSVYTVLGGEVSVEDVDPMGGRGKVVSKATALMFSFALDAKQTRPRIRSLPGEIGPLGQVFAPSFVERACVAWESKFLSIVFEFSEEFEKKDDDVQVVPNAFGSMDEALAEASEIPLIRVLSMAAGFVIAYAFLVTGSRSLPHSNFVILNSFYLSHGGNTPVRLGAAEAERAGRARVRAAVSDSGIGITMTTTTTVTCFAIGVLSPYLAIQWFCVNMIVCLTLGYLTAVSCVVAALGLDVRRELLGESGYLRTLGRVFGRNPFRRLSAFLQTDEVGTQAPSGSEGGAPPSEPEMLSPCVASSIEAATQREQSHTEEKQKQSLPGTYEEKKAEGSAVEVSPFTPPELLALSLEVDQLRHPKSWKVLQAKRFGCCGSTPPLGPLGAFIAHAAPRISYTQETPSAEVEKGGIGAASEKVRESLVAAAAERADEPVEAPGRTLRRLVRHSLGRLLISPWSFLVIVAFAIGMSFAVLEALPRFEVGGGFTMMADYDSYFRKFIDGKESAFRAYDDRPALFFRGDRQWETAEAMDAVEERCGKLRESADVTSLVSGMFAFLETVKEQGGSFHSREEFLSALRIFLHTPGGSLFGDDFVWEEDRGMLERLREIACSGPFGGLLNSPLFPFYDSLPVLVQFAVSSLLMSVGVMAVLVILLVSFECAAYGVVMMFSVYLTVAVFMALLGIALTEVVILIFAVAVVHACLLLPVLLGLFGRSPPDPLFTDKVTSLLRIAYLQIPRSTRETAGSAKDVFSPLLTGKAFDSGGLVESEEDFEPEEGAQPTLMQLRLQVLRQQLGVTGGGGTEMGLVGGQSQSGAQSGRGMSEGSGTIRSRASPAVHAAQRAVGD
uniref:SSD domain-containing protein n=1 Tax=Chromera velia CCMP2878 TaxID=1169474 RepID=A0A0G4HD19_9ALVE|eukprot:Cvel_6388.t1-p1 / transcript=Cvel_6388.t1 / gene=Cvel_6388 / organism=Chromera_velia_CCMP2878 / gene_product=hypothetical protein / transcript_product=hypothetical protein / location=Cvel_scaffold311:89933-97565(+) / protein_length=997 / sequence_SO=supercontig / SO=protein_coding / is_pseudo=false